jgi:hypothetical protein
MIRGGKKNLIYLSGRDDQKSVLRLFLDKVTIIDEAPVSVSMPSSSISFIDHHFQRLHVEGQEAYHRNNTARSPGKKPRFEDVSKEQVEVAGLLAKQLHQF